MPRCIRLGLRRLFHQGSFMSASSRELAPSIHVSRRTLLRLAAISVASGAAGSFPFGASVRSVLAQDGKSAKGELVPLNRFSRMVQEWFVEQVRTAENKTKERLAAL